MTVADELTDAEFMLDRERWPMWPVLPVKRRVEGGPVVQCGVLYDVGENQDTLDHEGRGALTIEAGLRPPTESIRYDSLAAAIEDGWVVD